ncbi:lyase family protein [Pseudoclavibacter terrae]|uniref:lyase family protein n=1 Tax=Pseudoclavibacter terrae TaxID=1530195 RepID=UPI00232C57F9|nr:lyase family protein [Pseudoclavibacter terrae]
MSAGEADSRQADARESGARGTGSGAASDEFGGLVRGMLVVEAELLRAWASLESRDASAAATDVEAADLDAAALRDGIEADGVIVPELVRQLRASLASAGVEAPRLHAGATSQDIVDSASMLHARDALTAVRADLVAAGTRLQGLADAERRSPRVAYTLGRQAAASTIGVQFAGWLDGITSAIAAIDGLTFPVQFGGAVGTGEAADRLGSGAQTTSILRAHLAAGLGLHDPRRAWHAERTPVLAVASAATAVCTALGRIARDLVTASGERVGELSLGGGGTSSAMPHKQNPVAPIVVVSNALQAPGLLATVASAAISQDERPAGEWHAEWDALRRLLELAGVSARRLAASLDRVTVERETARHHLADSAVAGADQVTLQAANRVVNAAISRFLYQDARPDGDRDGGPDSDRDGKRPEQTTARSEETP